MSVETNCLQDLGKHGAWKIGYVLKRFPKLSETFILNEILQLEERGTPLEIFSLLRPLDEPRNGVLSEIQSTVTYLPQDLLPEWWIREERLAEGCFEVRSFKELSRPGKLPKTLVSQNVLGGLLNQLLQRIRNLDDLPIFASQMKALSEAAALAGLVKAKGVKHLHAHFATTVAMLASRLAGVSFSFSAHAVDIYHRNVNRELLKEMIRRAQFVATCTEYNRRVLAGLAGQRTKSKILRFYHGVDVTRVQPDPSIPREADLILAVGRLVEKKGFCDLLHACQLLRDQGRSFRCLILGEGEERGRLTDQIRTLRLSDRVVLVGAVPQEQVLNLMKRATVLVLPCVVSTSDDQDGLPNVLIEAQAVGLPVISTTLSGIPEIIEHNKTGLLVPPRDPACLAAAVEKLLSHPGLGTRLAGEGRKKVLESFDIRKNTETLRHRFRMISARPVDSNRTFSSERQTL